MKRRIIITVCLLSLLLSIAILNYVRSDNAHNPVFDANVEALASIEWPWQKQHECYDIISAAPAMKVFYCGECRLINGRAETNELSECKK